MGVRVWVDDNRPAPEGWVWTKTAEEAKVRLLTGDVEELSLDYDLDSPECPVCDFRCGLRDAGQCGHACQCHRAGDENGQHLVEWMERWGCWPRQKPVVHSTNGHGGESMKAIIERAYPNRT